MPFPTFCRLQLFSTMLNFRPCWDKSTGCVLQTHPLHFTLAVKGSHIFLMLGNKPFTTKTLSGVPAIRCNHSMVTQPCASQVSPSHAEAISASQAHLSSSSIPTAFHPASPQESGTYALVKASSTGNRETSQQRADASISSSYFLTRRSPEIFSKE